VAVTAKLSRRFYETFGDDMTNELVDWFNQVDSEHRSELKDMADLYYSRFRAEMRSEMAGLRSELLKWMFVFWAGNVLATASLVFAAIKLSHP
jgi:hypothetical protein